MNKLTTNNNKSKNKMTSMLGERLSALILVDHYENIIYCDETAKRLFKFKLNNPEWTELATRHHFPQFVHDCISNKKETSYSNLSINNREFSANFIPLHHPNIGNMGCAISIKEGVTHNGNGNKSTNSFLSLINDLLATHSNDKQTLRAMLKLYLKITNSDVGSIRLKDEDAFITSQHLNFPEKIQKLFKYSSGKTFAEKAIESKKMIIKEPYDYSDKELNQNTRLIVEAYIVIPIISNKECIATIHLARKFDKGDTLIDSALTRQIKSATIFSTLVLQHIMDDRAAENCPKTNNQKTLSTGFNELDCKNGCCNDNCYLSTHPNTDTNVEQLCLLTDSSLPTIKLVRQYIEKECKKRDIPNQTIKDIQLAVSEAQANIIQHAYFDDQSQKIVFNFLFHNQKIEVILNDYSEKSLKNDTMNKTIGIDNMQGSGLGLHIIQSLMDDCEYINHKHGCILKLTKNL